VGEAELRGLAQAFLAALRRADFAGQADFAEHHQLLRQRAVAQRGHDGEQHGQRSAAGSVILTPPTALTKTS
jgi:hypothetical protein